MSIKGFSVLLYYVLSILHVKNFSLMVEELARWKSALSIRISELQDNVNSLLEERSKVRSNSLETFCNLMELSDKHLTSDKVPSLRNSNILELATVNNSLSANLLVKLFSEQNNNNKRDLYAKTTELPNLTAAESVAAKVQHPLFLYFCFVLIYVVLVVERPHRACQ